MAYFSQNKYPNNPAASDKIMLRYDKYETNAQKSIPKMIELKFDFELI